jgi:predicted RNase H-like nuclease (RuvC/YqgF family)
MTREEAINILDEIQSFDCNQYYKPYAEAFDQAISDMKRVEKLERLVENLNAGLSSKIIIIDGLEAENKRLKEDLSRWQEGEYNHCDLCCSTSRYELKRLKEGIKKVKAEIEEYQYENKYAEAVKDNMEGWICAFDAINIINKYLGEVGDK